VAMFDLALQLTAWNRHFQEMLDLSDAYLAERHTYAEFVREPPSNWWTPLLSSGGSGKVSNEPGTASFYG